MSDTPTPADPAQINARPRSACLLCPPPRTSAWRLADSGYRTCSDCLDRLRDRLADIVRRWVLLNPTPGSSGDHGSRGAPGFGSRSPASDHVIAMRDRRSSLVAKVWVGKDGRVHQEPERPPLSVHSVLETLAWDIAEARDITPPDPRADVPQLARYLDGHLDWATRQDNITELDQPLRALVAQLKPVTGDPARPKVGDCPNVDPETQQECGATLRAPIHGDTIQCTKCERTWERPEWEHLGRMIQQQSLEHRLAS